MKSLSKIRISYLYTFFFLILFIVAIAIAINMRYSSQSLKELQYNTERYIDVQEAISNMKEASDYLTEHCRAYIVAGDKQDMLLYYDEALNVKRRDASIETLHKYNESQKVTQDLEYSLKMSNELMDIEEYAMKMVCYARGYDNDQKLMDYVKHVHISKKDMALSSAEKIEKATDMVFDETYASYKTSIHQGVYNGLDMLVKETRNDQFQSYNAASRISFREHILFVVIIILGTLSLVLTAVGVIVPINRSITYIESNEKLPVSGAAEYSFLASTFNDMQEKNMRYSEMLSYEATHDELTGLYNRKMFEDLREDMADKQTALLIIDVDEFKQINDGYGHAAGDKVLKKVANAISTSFRSQDSVCRIGGDEFAVIMMDITPGFRNVIRSKIEMIQNRIAVDDGSPDVTVSMGIAFSVDAESADELFRNADDALYRVKNTGKNNYMFHRDVKGQE